MKLWLPSKEWMDDHVWFIQHPILPHDQPNDYFTKRPQEIWWNILDNVIAVPILFSTIYKEGEWVKDAYHFMRLTGIKHLNARGRSSTLYVAHGKYSRGVGEVALSGTYIPPLMNSKRLFNLQPTNGVGDSAVSVDNKLAHLSRNQFVEQRRVVIFCDNLTVNRTVRDVIFWLHVEEKHLLGVQLVS
jgi:hypothetical protein